MCVCVCVRARARVRTCVCARHRPPASFASRRPPRPPPRCSRRRRRRRAPSWPPACPWPRRSATSLPRPAVSRQISRNRHQSETHDPKYTDGHYLRHQNTPIVKIKSSKYTDSHYLIHQNTPIVPCIISSIQNNTCQYKTIK